jgi:hypothetical protein
LLSSVSSARIWLCDPSNLTSKTTCLVPSIREVKDHNSGFAVPPDYWNTGTGINGVGLLGCDLGNVVCATTDTHPKNIVPWCNEKTGSFGIYFV